MKRAWGVAGATTLLLFALGVMSKPAGAVGQPGIKVGPNQTVEVTHPAPLGGGNAYLGSVFDPTFDTSPDSCATGASSAYCDTIPLELVVPDIHKGFYSLSFTLSWPATNIVIPGTGTLPDSQLGLGVWDDPIVADDDSAKTCNPDDSDLDYYLCFLLGPSGGEPGGDESYANTWLANEQPIRFGMVPKRTKFSVVIANYYGAPANYTLKVSLISVTAGSLNDLSLEVPKDLSSGGGSDFGTPALPVAPAINLPSAPDVNAFGLADLGPQTELSGLKINGEDSLDLNPSILQRRAVAIRRPGNESAFWLWLWLVALPVAAAGGTTLWFIRRRALLIA